MCRKTINYILDNTEDENVYEQAFHFIEQKFPNSRIYATHHMMKTIETMNSKTYDSMVSNLFLDIQNWISRTYGFKKELNNRKQKLLILSLLTMASSIFFSSVFTNNSIFSNFVEMPLYQWSTFIFLALCILLYYGFYVSMDGKWMVNDQSLKNEVQYIKAFRNIVLKNSNKPSNIQLFTSITLILVGYYFWYFKENSILLFICMFLSIYIYNANNRGNKKYHKKVKKALEIEFPIWLRDVCLNLQNYTVLNAIEKSRDSSSIILQYYIERFIEKTKDNPVSITPYCDFLKEYDIPDVKADLKVLFSLSTHSEKQIAKEVDSLIVRNQELIEKSEKIKNNDFISIIGRLGFLPVILFVFNMFTNMGLLFLYLMDFMNNAIHL